MMNWQRRRVADHTTTTTMAKEAGSRWHMAQQQQHTQQLHHRELAKEAGSRWPITQQLL